MEVAQIEEAKGVNEKWVEVAEEEEAEEVNEE